MPYPGGKAGAGTYQRIINQIPPHDTYIEPFLGDGAILRHKRPAAQNIAIEIDPAVASAFRLDLAATSCGEDLHLYNCDAIEWLKHHFHLYRLPWAPPPNPALPAGAALSRAGRSTPSATPLHSPAPDPGLPFSAHSGPATAHPASPADRTFIYLDPPYLLHTRRSKRPLYRYELTPDQHAELLHVLTRIDQASRGPSGPGCCIAISGYMSPLYSAALQDWRLLTFTATTRGRTPATECLWMNYPPPPALHDTRYLGNGKRQRERIRRKVRTWAAGLQRLPLLEQQAILAALPTPWLAV